MTEEMNQNQPEGIEVNDQEAAAYIQEALKEAGVDMDQDKIVLVIEHYYGYLATLGLVQEVE
ncbi:hypothetical protein [Heyndrickxia sporothermodurans]|uniref:hypothetical protein n=1 Tax=Heyndrickxia sporothermodurans TaxID=46224 RepID=UPI000D39C2B2|nr:hypothetical protein [Heyndrickxia sporothermodurans]PTY93072.1 hypothetical protein B5V90_03020 [Heyndrickxia sporothermodurans]